MHTVRNEQTNLLATYFNNFAAAFAIAGFIAPLTNGLVIGVGRFILALAWIGISMGLHLLARAILEGSKQ